MSVPYSQRGCAVEYIALWLFLAIACAVVASSKGRSAFGWLLLGVFFSFFALLVVAILPSIRPVVVKSGEPEPTPQTHVRCPDCAELVRKEASKCRHCGCVLVPQK